MCNHAIGIDYIEPGAATLVLQRCGCFQPNLSSEDKYKPCTPGGVETFCLQTNQAKVGVGTAQKKTVCKCFSPSKRQNFFCYRAINESSQSYSLRSALHLTKSCTRSEMFDHTSEEDILFAPCSGSPAAQQFYSLSPFCYQSYKQMMWAWSLESGDMKTFHWVKAETLRSPGFKPPIHFCAVWQERQRQAWTIAQIVGARQCVNRKATTTQIINKSRSADVFRLRWFSGMLDWWWELNLLGVCGTWRQHKDKITHRQTDRQFRGAVFYSQ